MAYPQVSFTHTTLSDDALLGRTRRVAWANTIPRQLDILKETGRYHAFKLQPNPFYHEPMDHWPVPKHLFWDSDIAKWLEGACYFLHTHKDAKVESAVHELVDMIRHAQQPDGYINIHFTVVAPSERWSNVRDLHEMYNAGHLIEAALAHEQLYHNGKLLDPLVKYADYICDTFGPGEKQIRGYPGHPEIELALLRLYSHTQNPRYLERAQYFIEERGKPTGCEGRHYFDVEAEKRGEQPYERPNHYPQRGTHWYNQAHKPIVEQDEVVGHSVRAMYLLIGVADLMLFQKNNASSGVDYRKAVSALWNNTVQRKMSVTGGMGAMKQWEGFGVNDFLPQSTDEGGCYNETCASIAIVMLADRLLRQELNAEYADVMELALYNTILNAMSRDGKQFTYANQLSSSDADPSQREKWFTVACCPPNVARLLGSLGGYIWNAQVTKEQERPRVEVNVHLFTSATLEIPVDKDNTIKLVQTTNYPWTGDIQFQLEGASNANVQLRIRIPTWAKTWSVSPSSDIAIKNGYITIPSTYSAQHPTFSLSLPVAIRTLSQPRSNASTISFARGPIVYCAEDADNPWVTDHFVSVYLDLKATKFEEVACDDRELGEHYVGLKVSDGIFIAEVEQGALPGVEKVTYRPLQSASGTNELHFVPYYLRANRGGKGHMRVGMKKLV